MIPLLADAQAAQLRIDANTLGDLSLPEVPSQGQMVDFLLGLGSSDFGAVVALLLFVCGLVYLLQGWKIFKALVIVNAAVLGAMAGSYVGAYHRGQHTQLYAAIAGAALLAILAWPLMKYAVSLMGGLAGSFLGYGVWQYATEALSRPELNQHAWAGAIIGLVTLGLLAFVIFKVVITVFTAVQGSVMSIAGISALLLKHESLRQDFEPQLRENAHLAVLLIAVPTLIGFGFQYSAAAKKAKKKKKALEGDKE